jgi:C1A family cysteine protease
MKLKKITLALIQASVFTLLLLPEAYAEQIELIGSLKHTLKQADINSSSHQGITDSIEKRKVIQLLKVKLSDEEKIHLKSQAQDAKNKAHQFSVVTPKAIGSALPNSIQLGMNKVPVLDQGVHGTCVTFSVTGALDAVIGKGDYLSQLCNLQLGTYLEQHGYGNSGWDGSYAINVINQIEQYGAVNMEKQHTIGCGGLTSYPIYFNIDSNSFIEPQKFSSISEPVFGKVATWSDIEARNDSVSTLNYVKESLNSGDRLVFAVLLPRVDLGSAGAVGQYKTWFAQDSWVLTPDILKGIDDIEAAHEMIITGYDDNAKAVDDNGKQHKGLLKLRNSWGVFVGDWGEFYMSYDYFKLLSYDVKRISAY